MTDQEFIADSWNPGRTFYIGLALVMLALWLPFIPAWYTFIHMWRVDMAASVFLAVTLSYLLYRFWRKEIHLAISNAEVKLVVLPVAAMVLWSAASMAWAPSWKSAAHHTLVWAEYLVFFLVVRHLLDSGRNFGRLQTTFAVSLVLLAIPAVAEYCAFMVFGGTTTLGMRYAKWGEQIVTLLPLLIIGIVRLNGRRFLVGLSVVAAMWLLVFCSFGRTNIFLFVVGFAAVSGTFLVFKRLRRYRRKIGAVALVLVVSPLPVQMFSLLSETPSGPTALRRFTEETSASGDGSRGMMNAISWEMITANPVLGVGADNYGMQVNKYRAAYGVRNPDDPRLSIAENEIPAHAHNELIQIVAELGIVGGAIALWLLAGICLTAFRALRGLGRGSLYPFAAVLGLGLYLASSLVSAYSFRVIQNGFVFFFVLAVATKFLLKERNETAARRDYVLKPMQFRFAAAASMFLCLCLAVYSGIRVGSVILATRASHTQDLHEAADVYRTAMDLDDENPDARNNFGMRLFHEQRFAESIPYLQAAIAIGRAPSCDFSYLASAQALSGDNAAAEQTMAEAAALYPRSTFVLTRYAVLLDENGKADLARDVFSRARAIDGPRANSWRAMIDKGPKAVSDLAARDPEYVHVMELLPHSSIYAAVAERFIKFPDEKKWSAFKNGSLP